MFKRRNSLGQWERAREWVYPRSGWRRAIEYVGHRIKRLPDTPHKIALGFACGVFVSFSPLFGFHFIYAGLCAWIVRGNILASFIGTLVGNPLTFPLMATTSLTFGRWLMGVEGESASFAAVKDAFVAAAGGIWQSLKAAFGLAEPALDKLQPFLWEVFIPYYIGGIVPGLIAAVGFYFLTQPLIDAYQSRRRARQMARAKARLMADKAAQMIKEGS